MNIQIETNSKELEAAFRKAPAKTTKTLRSWIGTTAAMVERQEKQEVPVRAGILQNSIHIIQSGLRAEVKPTSKYAIWVHEGTGIYGKRRSPIKPKNGKFLVFKVGGQTVFARSVKGQKPNKFADRTFKAVKPRAELNANRAVDQLVRSI